ncbi:MAG: hypothetical protein KY469_16485 [Actinobacteria bacterium]|nr:hypothetical protein [Actinomycetota bacterium]
MGVAVIVVSALSLHLTASATAQTNPAGFSAIASATGASVAVVAPGLTIVDTIVDLGGGVAQAEVTSLGVSQAFAASPDPGELVLTGPGLIAGLSGLPFPNPEQPTVARSSYPSQPEASSAAGPYAVTATSEALRSDALSLTGTDGIDGDVAVRSRSTATGYVEEGSVVAEAVAVAEPATFGPLVIGRVSSSVRVIVGPDGSPQVERSFHADGVTVDGVGVEITEEGLQVAGNAAPLETSPVGEALAQAGVEVHMLGGAEDAAAGTATSTALRISVRHVLTDGIPNVVPPGQEVELRYTFGLTTAAVQASPIVAPGTSTDTPPPPATGTQPVRSAPSDPAPPPTAPRLPLSAPPLTTRAAPPSIAPPVGSAADPPVDAPTATSPRMLLAASEPLEAGYFYPVLVVGALAALVSMHTTRTGGRASAPSDADTGDPT